jgi:hypothetical protein
MVKRSSRDNAVRRQNCRFAVGSVVAINPYRSLLTVLFTDRSMLEAAQDFGSPDLLGKPVP